MNSLTFRILLLVVYLFSAGSLFAQTADVSGTVIDQSGAVVPNAQVRLVNQATLVERATATNSQGVFTAPFINPGVYQLFVEAPGFSTQMMRDIKIDVAAKINLPIRLKVGGGVETVVADAATTMMNSTDASVSTVIDRKFVENIPLNGRSFQDLISMTPGVVTQSPQSGSGVGIRGDFSVNGQRTESNYYTVDGVTANLGTGNGNGGTNNSAIGGSISAGTVFGTTQSLVSVDALQEFRVQSSAYSAEYGRSPGAQFTLTTRSGGNNFHGTAFDYLRNNFFDANDWFNDHYGQPLAALRQNDYGGTLGGPIWIPKLYNGKDNSFFFASYEGLRLRQPQGASIQYVPDNYMRQSQQLDPAIQQILNAFPIQTGLDYGSEAAPSLAQFIKSYSLPGNIDSTSIRIDHTFNPRIGVFFRFGDTPSSAASRTLSALISQHTHTSTYTLGVTSHLLNLLDNELRIGYARNDASVDGTIDNFGSAVPIDLSNAMGLGNYAAAEPIFELYYSGIGDSTLSATGPSGSRNEGRQWNATDTSSISLRLHQIRFGADFRRIRTPSTPADPLAEALFFGTSSVLANQATILYLNKTESAEPIFNEVAAFVQDEWHVGPRLNLSLGLRWEANPPPHDAHGNDAYTLLGNVADPKSLTLAPRGTALWKTPWYNFAPRLGAAWTARDAPGQETVIRAGGGVFFDTNNQTASYGFGGLGFSATQFYFDSPVPATSSQLDFTTTPSAPYTSSVVYAFPQHLQLPYTLQWNVSLEQALGKDQAVTISYVGANGRRLEQGEQRSISALNSQFGTIAYFPNGVTSSYNALQTKYQRRLVRGVQALASYTWSHSLDFGSNYLALPTTRGNSDFDVRNTFSAALSWDLPKLDKMQFIQTLANGWGLDARVITRTAFPVTLRGAYLTDSSTGNSYYGNVNIVSGEPIYLYGAQYPGGRKINPAAFSIPTDSSIGNAPRNFVRGFGETQANLAIRRDFKLHEGVHLQFRAEAFNFLNHPNYGAVDVSLTSATFGEALSMLNQSLGTMASQYQQGGPRSMQFALRLVF